MKLWYLTLGINADEGILRKRAGLAEHPMYHWEFKSDFSYETRALCNYLLKRVRKLRFETDGFNQIAIKASLEPSSDLILDSSNNIRCQVPFNFDRYQRTPKSRQALSELQIELIKAGLDKINAEFRLPTGAYLEAIDEFRKADYLNEWVVKSIYFKAHGLRCQLLASFDVAVFEMNLIVKRAGNTIYTEMILETKPDEILFNRTIKDICLIDNHLALIEPIRDKVIWHKPLEELDLSKP